MANQTASEKAKLIVQWLDFQNESLSLGLRSVADAERLYDHWMEPRHNLPEFADQDEDDEGRELAAVRKMVLGYDPLAA